jgi:pilus assembly protein Flp/PilA
MSIYVRIVQCLGERRGVTSIEYGLIAGLVAVALIAGATIIGHVLQTVFANVNNGFPHP